MTVLHDEELDKIARAGAVDPYDPSRLQPASIDFTLGTTFMVPRSGAFSRVDLADVPLDLMRREDHEDEFWLPPTPNGFALGRTAEIIRVPNNIVARMEGKSSLGRLGLIVHVTAGFFDPGFEGYGTLEFVNLLQVPIVLRLGMPICQFSFQYMTGEAKPYAGRYRDGNDATGSRYGHEIKAEWRGTSPDVVAIPSPVSQCCGLPIINESAGSGELSPGVCSGCRRIV